MAFRGTEYAVTGTATKLTTALGITDPARTHVRQVILRNHPSAAQDAFFGASVVTTTTNRAGILRATDAYPTVMGGGDCHPLSTEDIYLIGTAGASNIIFITIVD
jgi:hypothetical protein